jgi:hypothetical protein
MKTADITPPDYRTIEKLTAENARLREDAARWRFAMTLGTIAMPVSGRNLVQVLGFECPMDDDFETAIDAARKKE